MTKEVKIIIEGMELGPEGESIMTKALGTYHYRNGAHYIQYGERSEEEGNIIRSMLKLAYNQLTIKRDGQFDSHMVFDLSGPTNGRYGTPYGSLSLEVHTRELSVMEAEDELQIFLQYTLADKGANLLENQVTIWIKSNH